MSNGVKILLEFAKTASVLELPQMLPKSRSVYTLENVVMMLAAHQAKMNHHLEYIATQVLMGDDAAMQQVARFLRDQHQIESPGATIAPFGSLFHKPGCAVLDPQTPHIAECNCGVFRK